MKAAVPVPDLLSVEPSVRVDDAALRQTLVFAFAVGASLESFQEITARAKLPPSTFDRTHYARDLFLDALLERALALRVQGRSYEACTLHLARAIGEPPRDGREIAMRQRVLGELARHKELRADFERVYLGLHRLRAQLCSGREGSRSVRRLEILRAVQSVFTDLAKGFEGAEGELGRLRAFGEAVVASPPFRRLDALLDHEAHLGTLDLRVRVGSDGEIRTFQIVKVRENRENPFYSSPFGRFLARLLLFFRGYRMNGGEVVERMFDDVFSALEEPLVLAFQLLGDMEFYLAGLAFADRAKARGLDVAFGEMIERGAREGMRVEGLWNPLLLLEKRTPVPCDVRTADGGSVVVVTGPNSGGKTRLFQAIALAQLLAEAGLFAPVKSARLPRVRGLFVSLLDEARADQPEGQLGMELLRIRRIFEQIDLGSLVLLDELCSGTNPSEGEEIARLVISLLPELEAQVFVSTHLLSFAARLAERSPDDGIRGPLEFLQVELGPHEVPTYRFVPGVARTSLAHKTAARLGVTLEDLSGLIAAKKRDAAPASEHPSAPPDVDRPPVTSNASVS